MVNRRRGLCVNLLACAAFVAVAGCGMNRPAAIDNNPVGQTASDNPFQGPIDDDFDRAEPDQITEAPIEEPIPAMDVPPMQADLNGDGFIDDADVDRFQGNFGAGADDENFDPAADFDGDGQVTLVDFQMFLNLIDEQS
jgi:hypothetical protein